MTLEAFLPLLFAGGVGFSHAFEVDHLVAVSNIVTKRNNLTLAIKDGIYWGLGHTSTILIIGILMILLKTTFLNGYFMHLEAIVGLMLILLGVYRLHQYFNPNNRYSQKSPNKENHNLAYGVGLIHGLAGSGALILLVMTEIKGDLLSIIYLIIFGIGSVLGMVVAACISILPFSKKFNTNYRLQLVLVILSSVLCIGYGVYVLTNNIFEIGSI